MMMMTHIYTLLLIHSTHALYMYNIQLEAEEEALKHLKLEDIQEEHYKILNKAYLLAIRRADNVKQQLKGEISLDIEDTGTQYKND